MIPNIRRPDTCDVKNTALCRKYFRVPVHKDICQVDDLVSRREQKVLHRREPLQRLQGKVNAICRKKRSLSMFSKRGYETIKIMIEQPGLTIC